MDLNWPERDSVLKRVQAGTQKMADRIITIALVAVAVSFLLVILFALTYSAVWVALWIIVMALTIWSIISVICWTFVLAIVKEMVE